MTDKELLQQALDAMLAAIKSGDWKVDGACDPDSVIEAIKARLAQAEKQEPVAWADKYDIEREGHDFYVNRQQPSKDGVPLFKRRMN